MSYESLSSLNFELRRKDSLFNMHMSAHQFNAPFFIVFKKESPLSSKVAMFNNQAQQHKQAQLLNPFAAVDGRSSPKPTFSKDEYGKPLAGSMTELRGQKANMHVLKEMLELCQIISSEGYEVNDEPDMRVIPFGELFNIYNYISDKVVGILLRARKHKLVDFEGEMLFQRRDDNVPVFLLKPIREIRAELDSKVDEIKRASSPAPQATTLLLDRSAHQKRLEDAGLVVPGTKRNAKSKSRSPSPVQSLRSIASAPVIVVNNDHSVAAPQAEVQVGNDIAAKTATAGGTTMTPPTAQQPTESSGEIMKKSDVNNNNNNANTNDTTATPNAIVESSELPTIVVDAAAVYVRKLSGAAPSNETTQMPAPVDAVAQAGQGQAQAQEEERPKVTFY